LYDNSFRAFFYRFGSSTHAAVSSAFMLESSAGARGCPCSRHRQEEKYG
jgi:hypothetical protein